ncbi:MAG: primase-helicase family protein, partial [Myxococcaceae bacterium]
MLFSKFKNVYDNLPKTESISWPEFIHRYSQHIIVSTKESAPAISPAEWPAGLERKKEDVLRVHFAALDLDGVSSEVVDRLKAFLESTSYLMYTTWSHAESVEKSGLSYLRVFIELSRPVEIHEWRYFWSNLNQFTGGFLDEACKDAGRIYFAPSVPKISPLNWILAQEKTPLNVETILRQNVVFKNTPNPAGTSNHSITREALVSLARGLRARANPNQQQLGLALKKVLDKEPFAEPGERDSTIYKLACLLAEQWPEAKPEDLASYFKLSLVEMASLDSNSPTLEDVIEKIARKQGEVRARREHETQSQNEFLETRILEAFSGKRSHGYTPEEIEQFAADAGVPSRIFKKRWIIDCEGSNYLFVNGDYLPPVSTARLVITALDALAPAHTVDVTVENITARGRRILKTEKELFRDYGTTASKVIADMSAQRSSYDWETRIFTEAVCPLRNLKPEFSQNVDQYLRIFAGEHQEKLLDWIATVTCVQSPTAALYLHGVSGAGKTLLPHALARIWKLGGATELVDVVESFNASLASCPIVLADEHLPRILKKEGSSADIRTFIQARSRPLRRKYKGPAEIVGSARLIMTANNMNLLGNSEYLSSEDVGALQNRILYIYSDKNSEDFLNSLSHDEREDFVKGDILAKHALWLRDNRKVEIGPRLLVPGNTSRFHNSLATATGIRSALCDWITSYLQEPK